MEENCYKNNTKQFAELYETNVIDPKDYSFIIIDKSKDISKRYILCKQGKESMYLKLQ